MKRVVLPIANGFEEIEAITIIDILRRAGVVVVIAGVTKQSIVGAHGVKMTADAVVADLSADEFDMLVLAGGYDNAITLSNDATTQKLISTMHKNGKLVAAICAAPLALHKAGVISGEYTCYPSVEETIKGKFVAKSVVESNRVITSRGPATASDFAFYLVEKLVSKAKKEEVQKTMLYI